MTERTPRSINTDDTTERTSPEVKYLKSLKLLGDIEDGLVEELYPGMKPDEWYQWGCRTPLDQLIRTEDLYGEIAGLSFDVIENPLKELVAIKGDDSKKFVYKYAFSNNRLDNPDFAESANNCVGFRFAAHLGTFDLPLSAQVWLMRIPDSVTESKRKMISNARGGILRFVAVPEGQNEKVKKARITCKLNRAALGSCTTSVFTGPKRG